MYFFSVPFAAISISLGCYIASIALSRVAWKVLTCPA